MNAHGDHVVGTHGMVRAAEIPLLLPGGRRLTISGDDRDVSVVGALVSSDGNWEPHVRGLFERLVQPDWVCLDIGANIGAHTLALACLARRVYAFEASPANFAHLETNVAATGMSAKITPVLAAIWDGAGTVDVVASPEFSGTAFATADGSPWDGSDHVYALGDREVPFTFRSDTVPAVRLDDWVAEHELDRIDLIKIDVEGAEQTALAGATETLRRFKPLLVTEYNPSAATSLFGARPDAYFEFLADAFPSLHVIEPDGSLSEPLVEWRRLEVRLAEGRGWEDLLCVPETPAPRRGLFRPLAAAAARKLRR